VPTLTSINPTSGVDRHEHAGHSHRYQLYRRNHPLTPARRPASTVSGL
jgi:hypothetical protein